MPLQYIGMELDKTTANIWMVCPWSPNAQFNHLPLLNTDLMQLTQGHISIILTWVRLQV